jgi:geranylgeranyl reductase family protein
MFDVAIVGSGPAGSACAAFCASAGVRTLLLEREKFPREKVCGDCLNPACWPVLTRLGVAARVRQLPHGKLDAVEFIGLRGRVVRVPLPDGDDAEIAVRRNSFDALLMEGAREAGATIQDETTVTSLTREQDYWEIESRGKTFKARLLVAADGRNSTVARLLQLLPRAGRERVALQTHLPLPHNFGRRVVLQLLRDGYSGQAPVSDDQLNLCLVAKPAAIDAAKLWAEKQFGIAPDHPWRTVTPLTRGTIRAAQPGLLLVGDAARVVEPFTGEGIFYALRSGELAAAAIERTMKGASEKETFASYERAHAAMYQGRLWVNRLARLAVLNPRITSIGLAVARFQPSLLRFLTAKIVS